MVNQQQSLKDTDFNVNLDVNLKNKEQLESEPSSLEIMQADMQAAIRAKKKVSNLDESMVLGISSVKTTDQLQSSDADTSLMSGRASDDNNDRSLNAEQLSRVIEMAWEDRTPFSAIAHSYGLDESAVIKLMRQELQPASFRLWRKRVSGRVTKHQANRNFTVGRAYCQTQYKPR